GPSGVGKGAVVARLLAALPDLELSISATTRQPRPREDEGRHYHCVDRGKFDEMAEAGGFLEWADIFGERYGTPREPIDRAVAEGRDVLVEIDVQGARQVKAVEPRAFMVFITPPSPARPSSGGAGGWPRPPTSWPPSPSSTSRWSTTTSRRPPARWSRSSTGSGGVPSTAVTRASRSGSTDDRTQDRRPAGPGRLQVHPGHPGRQAGQADQRLLQPARRGHRRVRPADGRRRPQPQGPLGRPPGAGRGQAELGAAR